MIELPSANPPLDPNAIVIWILGIIVVIIGIGFAVILVSIALALGNAIFSREYRDFDPKQIADGVEREVLRQMRARIRNRR